MRTGGWGELQQSRPEYIPVKFGTPLSPAEMHNIRIECAKGIYCPDSEDGESIPFFQRPMVIIFTAAISSMLFMWALLSAIM